MKKFEFNANLFPASEQATRLVLEKMELPEGVTWGVVLEKTGLVISITAETEEASNKTKEMLQDEFGASIYSFETNDFAEVIVKTLKEKGKQIAVAESCTGGLLSKRITDIPGASEVFTTGVTTYSNEAKNSMLNVSNKTLEQFGAVSKEVAKELCENIRKVAESDIGVGITGIAGPGGGTPEKPVGLVYIGVSTKKGYFVERLLLGENKDREDIRNEAVLFALYMINQAILETETYQKALIPYDIDEEEDEFGYGYQEEVYTPAPIIEPNKIKAFFKKVYEYLFPIKRDSKKEKIRKIAFLTAIVVFIGSASYIGHYFITRWNNDRQMEELKEAIDTPPTKEQLENLPEGYLKKFASLYSINQDIVGWLKITEEIEMPVVQFTDNDYYLKKDFYKKDNYHGIPFMDFRNSPKLTNTNTIIYGHNVKPDRMFATLTKYKKLAYYRQYPTFSYDSVYEEADWKILYVMIVDSDPSRGEYFGYHNFLNATSESDFYDFIEKCERRTLINTTVDVNSSDTLLTLSTCGFDFAGERIVIVARKVREGESLEVDVMNACANPKVQLPDIWYQIWGGEKPTFDDNSSGSDVSVPDILGGSSEESSEEESSSSPSSSSSPNSSTPPSSSVPETPPSSSVPETPPSSSEPETPPSSSEPETPPSSSEPETPPSGSAEEGEG